MLISPAKDRLEFAIEALLFAIIVAISAWPVLAARAKFCSVQR